MPAEWQGILNTTIRKFIREVEVDVMRNRKILAKLQAAGNVSYGWSGDQVEWRIQFRRAALQGMADADTLTFARVNRHKKANLDWRGYAIPDSVTKKEKLMNASTEAIVNRYTEVTKLLMSDMEDTFSDEFYIDGNLAGNDKRVHGLESFFGIATSSATGISANGEIIGTPIMAPSDTYAGINTDLGFYGGTWSPALGATRPWPSGAGSAEFDFYSPLIMDVTSTLSTASGGWSISTATWAARALEIVRYGIIKSGKNKTPKGVIDMVITDGEYFRLFLGLMQAEERIVVSDRSNSLKKLGFTDVINVDGVEVTWEYGCPASKAYGFNTNFMELRSLQDQLFVPGGPAFDEASQAYRFWIDFYGNLLFYPRYFFKAQEYGGDGA